MPGCMGRCAVRPLYAAFDVSFDGGVFDVLPPDPLDQARHGKRWSIHEYTIDVFPDAIPSGEPLDIHIVLPELATE